MALSKEQYSSGDFSGEKAVMGEANRFRKDGLPVGAAINLGVEITAARDRIKQEKLAVQQKPPSK